MPTDYYEVLGVDRGADPKAIKAAYRRLARQCHPDVNRHDPAAEDRFKQIQEAYAVLSDDEKRQQYDRFGANYEQYSAMGQGMPGGFRFESGDVDLGDLGGLFGGLFGRGRRGGGDFGFNGAPGGAAGQDVEVGVTVRLEEVDQGAVRDLTVPVEDLCSRCRGRGGDGRAPCTACGGRGKTRRQATVKGLKVPPGVADDDVLRVRGKGGHGAGGPDGDLLVRIRVQEHPFFRRDGDHLECEVPVTLAEAALGAEIPVPTLRGQRPLRLPAGTQGGQRFRIKGYGVPNRQSGEPGNLLVRCRVVVPGDLTPDEQAVLRRVSERGGDPRAELWQAGER